MRVSYSSIETYKTCPLKYKFQNIDKIREPKSKEAVFGTLIHSTMKFVHNPGIIQPTLEQALDFFSKNWNSDVFEQEVEERAAFSQGIKMIREYYEKNNPADFNIVSLESRFSIEIGNSESVVNNEVSGDIKNENTKTQKHKNTRNLNSNKKYEDNKSLQSTLTSNSLFSTTINKNNNHIISGIIDRIDKTKEGYEIIDYKTTKKMPSQEKVDNDLQLSIYLKAFLNIYPAEVENLDKIKVSLYYLKHGVKLTSTRTQKQLQETEQLFLDVISEIEKGKFEPTVTPLCDWCGYQKICPMWKHKFKEELNLSEEEINKIIEEYLNLKDQMSSSKHRLGELQEKIALYMDQQKLGRLFGEAGIIARTQRKTYKYDTQKLKTILEPLDKWEEAIKVDGTALRKILPVLPAQIKKEIEKTKMLDRESVSFSVKKK